MVFRTMTLSAVASLNNSFTNSKSSDDIECVVVDPLRHINNPAFMGEFRHSIKKCICRVVDLPLDIRQGTYLIKWQHLATPTGVVFDIKRGEKVWFCIWQSPGAVPRCLVYYLIRKGIGSPSQLMYLDQLIFGSINNRSSFGIIDTVLIRSEANDRTVLLVQLGIDLMILPSIDGS